MKLTIQRKDLAKALGAVSRLVPRKTTIPILSNIMLAAEADGLKLTANNLDIEGRASAPATVKDPGSVTVPGGTLSDIVARLPDGAEITMELDDKARLIVRAGRSRFVLPTLPVEDFPNIAIGDFDAAFEILAADLAAQFGAVSFAISSDEARYYLNGVYWHIANKKLVAVATDGHRLARMTEQIPEGAEKMPGVIVPREIVAEMARLLKGNADDDSVQVEVSSKYVRFTTGATVLTSKLIDGTFPDYLRVIPTENDKVATIGREVFAAGVDRMATVAETGHAIKLSFGQASVALSMRSTETGGEGTDEIEIDYSGADMEIGFNSRYLAEILDNIGSDHIDVKLADAGSPTLLLPAGGNNPTIVLMPMRV